MRVVRCDGTVQPRWRARTPCRALRRAGVVALLAGSVAVQSCAVTYRDSGGVLHVWGFSHVAVKGTPPDGGKAAVVESVATVGVSTGIWGDMAYFTVGWNRRQVIEVVDEDTAVSFDRLDGDLLTIRVGGEPRNETQPRSDMTKTEEP